MAVHIGDRQVVLIQRKARALLAYLAFETGDRETRDRLVGLLWSETENAKARASLRQLLHVLREVFAREGLSGLSIDNEHVGLDEKVFATDLGCALASIERGDPLGSLINEPRITDTLLRGYEDVDPAFDTWLTIKRETVRQQFIRRFEAQLGKVSDQPEPTKCIARALLQIEPSTKWRAST